MKYLDANSSLEILSKLRLDEHTAKEFGMIRTNALRKEARDKEDLL